MLFIQRIKLVYHKDVRYANYAQQRRAIRFMKVEKPKKSLEGGEICYFDHELSQSTEGISENSLRSNVYGENGFYNGRGDCGLFGHKIAILPDNGGYQVHYAFHMDKSYYTPKFTLRDGEYGRIVFNERCVYFDDGGWYYVLGTYNFLCCGTEKFSPKMFFRKETDYYFEDMKYLS